MPSSTPRKVRTAKEKLAHLQRDAGTKREMPPALSIGYGIARLARLIARNAARRVGEVLGLTLAEWRILLVVRDEPMHLDALADWALLEKSHASLAATALTDKRLVRRTVSPTDRRRVLFSRTALGTRAVDAYLAATARERANLWQVLSPAEQANLQSYVARLLDAADTLLAEVTVRRPYRRRRQS